MSPSWDKGKCAKGKSKEAREINFTLDDIKAQIIKHYQRLSDREAFVTAEMVRNAYQGIGNEYETLFGAYDKDNARSALPLATSGTQELQTSLRQGQGREFLQGVCERPQLCGGLPEGALQEKGHLHAGTDARLHQGVLCKQSDQRSSAAST